MAEPVEMPVAEHTPAGPRNHVFQVEVHIVDTRGIRLNDRARAMRLCAGLF